MVLPVAAFILAGSYSLSMTEELLSEAHRWYEMAALLVASHVAVVVGIRIIYNQFEFGGIRGFVEIFKDLFIFVFSLIFFPYILSTILEISGSLIDLFDPDLHAYTDEEIREAISVKKGTFSISLEYILTSMAGLLIEFSKFTYNYLVLMCFGISPIIMYLSIMAKFSGSLKTFLGVIALAVLWPILIKMSGQIIISVSQVDGEGINILSAKGASTFFLYAVSIFSSPALLWMVTGGGNPFSASKTFVTNIQHSYMKPISMVKSIRGR